MLFALINKVGMSSSMIYYINFIAHNSLELYAIFLNLVMKEQVIFIDNYGLVVGKFESIQQFNEWFKTQKEYRPNKDFSKYKLKKLCISQPQNS